MIRASHFYFKIYSLYSNYISIACSIISERRSTLFSDWMPEIPSLAPYRLRVAGPSTSTPQSYVVRTIDRETNIITADPSQKRAFNLIHIKDRGIARPDIQLNEIYYSY
jgi:hypothetical protein